MENPDENQIRMVVGRWAKAVRDGNMEGVLAQHTQDVVMFDVPMPLRSVGIEAYRKTWNLFFQYSPGGEGSFDPVELKITADNTVAFCHALLRIGGAVKPECRLTIGLRKINDEWLIVMNIIPLRIKSEQWLLARLIGALASG